MSEKLRFYTDEHIHNAIVRALRLRGVDVLVPQDTKMRGATDLEHLTYALKHKRVFITRDADFLRLHSRKTPHAGIVHLAGNFSIGETVRHLVLIHEAFTPEDMKNHVEFF